MLGKRSQEKCLGDQILEPGKHSLKQQGEAELIKSSWDQNLNQEQHQALNSALQHKITYIWGPPGTGKTKVIASIIDTYSQNGLSVLLLSHTNIATDEALFKTVNHFNQTSNPNLIEGKIIRIGNIRHQQLQESFGRYITRDNIVTRKTADLQEKVAECKIKLEGWQQYKSQVQKKLTDFKTYTQLVSLASRQRQEISEAESRLDKLTSDIADNQLQIQANSQKWLRYRSRMKLDNFYPLTTRLDSKPIKLSF